MGCGNSSEVNKTRTMPAASSNPADGEPMTLAEIENRIETISHTHTETFGGLRVRYAYLSQRGYYPDDLDKPNQDAYSITKNFCGQESDAFFGVYDGHGRDGEKCAQFAKRNLPELMYRHMTRAKAKESKLRRMNPNMKEEEFLKKMELTKEQIQAAALKSHMDCNKAMHRSSKFDDSLSGTTSISALLHGRRNRITVSNVGDSRAILGQRVISGKPPPGGGPPSSSLRAVPLSRDQTPYRRDERIRIRATGARILSLDQIEGFEPINDEEDDDASQNGGDLILGEEIDEGGDPPRVWSPHGEYPGTAFSRSFGDAIAEELGVFAEPEMITRELTPDDEIIVLASDGVFEFLTNQSVIDICAKFNDPLQACRAVVAESYELWLQYELRTDDITMICIFVDEVTPRSGGDFFALSNRDFAEKVKSLNLEPSKINAVIIDDEGGDDTLDAPIHPKDNKPVRNNVSKEKSKAIDKMKSRMVLEDDSSPLDDVDISKLYTEKSDEDKTLIAEAIRASVMFQNITDAQREMIFGVMEPFKVKKGDWVIRQGTVGDRFYIVDSGSFEVRIVPEGQEDKHKDGGNVVHVYHGSRTSHAHPSFGELALMYSAPRAASIIAKTNGQLWALHGSAFRKVLAEQTERKELCKVLRKVDAFKPTTKDDIKDLATHMEEGTYNRGDTIIQKGQLGDTFFVICQGGHCEQTKSTGETALLKADQWFGQEVLVNGAAAYTSTVVATSTTTCWKLDKSHLPKLRRRSSGNVA